nr:hypothetical protein [Tanacetum cinerariifolium]
MQKILALIVKYFKKIYKPTNSNLKTSSNSRIKNVDNTPRYKNDNQSGKFRSQRTMSVTGARENIGSPVVQQSRIQCYNCKEVSHFPKECRKPTRVKNSAYHKEKMLLCKQAEKGVPLQAEQSDWLADTDEEIDEKELEAHYSYMAKIQEVPTADLGTDSEPLEQTQKQSKKANTSLTHEVEQCKSILVETSKTLNESNSVRDSCLVALQTKQAEFEKYKAFVKAKHDGLVKQSLLTKSHYDGLVKEKTKVITDLKQKEDRYIDKMISMEKQLQFLNEIVYKRNQTIQTIHMLAPKGPTFNGRPTFANPMYLKKAQSKKSCLYEIPNDHSDPTNRLVPDREETPTLAEESQSKLNKDFTQNDSLAFFHELKQEIHADLKYVESHEKEIHDLESDKAEFSNMYDTILQECMSNDVMCTYLHSLSGLDAYTELQCLYLHKVKECDCLVLKLSKQTESVSKEVYTEHLRSFAKLEKHSISLELALQECQELMKNDTVYKEKASNVFQKEREQYFKIQDLKAQLKDKNIAINELKKLIDKCKKNL